MQAPGLVATGTIERPGDHPRANAARHPPASGRGHGRGGYRERLVESAGVPEVRLLGGH